MDILITQTKEWQKLQDDLEERTVFVCNDKYQYLGIIKKTPIGNYLYCPYGPCAIDKDTFELAIDSVLNYAKRTKLVFARIEPTQEEFKDYLPENAVKSKDLNPKETWVLDLTGTEEELKSRLPSRLLRYYKAAEKKGIEVIESHNPEDIMYLVDLQKNLADTKKINTFSYNYLKTEASQPFSSIYYVKYHDETTNKTEVIAAGLVFDDKKTRYNLQGAQSDLGRKLHATGILTIQLIFDASKKGLKRFDFWGIAPDDAPTDHPWRGFTEFKKTFAGTEVRHAGTYDLIVNPMKYRIYQLTRKLNQFIRRK